MNIVGDLYLWTDRVLVYGLLALRAWALIDCLTRKVAAFPAVDKLTKPAWVAMLLICTLLGYPYLLPLGVFTLITVLPACIYLTDVRPAVREITGGR